MKKLLFVVNPHAGRGLIKLYFWDIIAIFEKAGYSVATHFTTGHADATEYVRSTAQNYDCVVCCGGDGTLNETVNGLVAFDNPPVLGYIPAGTVNDVGYSLGIPSIMTDAAKTFVSGEPFEWDIGSFCGTRHFCYVAAFGMFTDVTYETPQTAKNLWGRAAYLLEGGKRLGKIAPRRAVITCDGVSVEDDYILGMVSNTVSVGGFRTLYGKLPKLDDGCFEVALVKKTKNLSEVQHVLNIMLQLESADAIQSDFLQILRGSHITFDFKRAVKWTVDGEYGGLLKHTDVVCETKRLRIVAGNKKRG